MQPFLGDNSSWADNASRELAPSRDETSTLMADLGWALLRLALAQTLNRGPPAAAPSLPAHVPAHSPSSGSSYESCSASAVSSCASFSSCRSPLTSPVLSRSVPACAGIEAHTTSGHVEKEEEECQLLKGYGLATSPRACASNASCSSASSTAAFLLLSSSPPSVSSSSDASSTGSYVCSEDSLGDCSPPSPAAHPDPHAPQPAQPRAATTTSCNGLRCGVVRPCGLVHTQRCSDLAVWAERCQSQRAATCSALPSVPIPVPSLSQQACRRRSDPGAMAAAQPFLDPPCPGEGVEAVGRRDPAQNPILVAVRDYYEAYKRQREMAPPHKPPQPHRRVVGFEPCQA